MPHAGNVAEKEVGQGIHGGHVGLELLLEGTIA
jgi:hypothetical protein